MTRELIDLPTHHLPAPKQGKLPVALPLRRMLGPGVILLGLSTAVVAIITLDGESHWFEGVQLLAVYAMIVVAVLFI